MNLNDTQKRLREAKKDEDIKLIDFYSTWIDTKKNLNRLKKKGSESGP